MITTTIDPLSLSLIFSMFFFINERCVNWCYCPPALFYRRSYMFPILVTFYYDYFVVWGKLMQSVKFLLSDRSRNNTRKVNSSSTVKALMNDVLTLFSKGI